MGRVVFYILWPLIWFYAPLTRRARAVIVHGGRVLVVKNWLGPGKWQLPGGGIKSGESITDATKRELMEELYLQTTSLNDLTDEPVVLAHAGLMMRLHFVAVTIENPEQELKMSSELIAVTWMKIDDLRDTLPEVERGLELVSNR